MCFSILGENCCADIINETFECKFFLDKFSKTYRWVNYTFLQKTLLTDEWTCSLPLGKAYYILGKWSFLRHRFFRFAQNLSFEILAFFLTKIINLARGSIGFDFGCPNRCFWCYFMMWFFHQKVSKIAMDLFCSKYDQLWFFCDYFS